tara:strand:- start:206 stop:556 length:351 start_codon:yes stop_codon:yes gene_type:complete
VELVRMELVDRVVLLVMAILEMHRLAMPENMVVAEVAEVAAEVEVVEMDMVDLGQHLMEVLVKKDFGLVETQKTRHHSMEKLEMVVMMVLVVMPQAKMEVMVAMGSRELLELLEML